MQLQQQIVERLQRVGEVALDGVLAEPCLARRDLVNVELRALRGDKVLEEVKISLISSSVFCTSRGST